MSDHLVPAEVPSGARLDRYLADVLGLSRARLKAAFEAGLIRVDGRRASKGDPVRPGSLIRAPLETGPLEIVARPDLPLEVLHEDPAFVVLDKPVGYSVHPLEAGETDTLANALVARYPECREASPDPRECGFVHRLDRDTSGVILAARTRDAHGAFREAFRERRVEKTYHALVGGAPGEEGTIDLPIAHHPKNARKMVVCATEDEAERLKARPALTRYRLLQWHGDYALLEVDIPTGVMHQIRVHLAAIGAPVVGDALYGGSATERVDHHLLHASRLAFEPPSGGEKIVVAAPLLDRWRSVLDMFGEDV